MKETAPKIGEPIKNINRNKEEYAAEFSEGCDSLKNLLCHLWDNNIETVACCAGHSYGTHYEKDTLFGRIKISEKAYLKSKSKGYYEVEAFSAPYLLFRCKEAQSVAKDIRKSLENQNLPFPVEVELDKWERIGIYNRAEPYDFQDTANRFFNAIQIAMDHALSINEREESKEISPKTVLKKSLHEQMIEADGRRIKKEDREQHGQRYNRREEPVIE